MSVKPFNFIENKFLCVTLVWLAFFCFAGQPGFAQNQRYADFKSVKFRLLDTALQSRKAQLMSYFQEIQVKASQIKEDRFARDFFKIMDAYQTLKQTGKLSLQSIRKTELLREKFKEHYIFTYQGFYDVLFLNPRGDIFYTIREQKDYLKNIFNVPLNETALAKKMRAAPSESFVDFQFYKISGEPSAFFIEPVQDGNEFYGWIILQFSINRINDLFSQDQNLGASGEVFLVNHDHYMLTDSRFRAESTILKTQLANENIAGKFSAIKGHKEVIDYRGQKVISSFDVFNCLDSQWLIIAKMDEAEIFTEYYRQNPLSLQLSIERSLGYQPEYTDEKLGFDACLEVDMDEFRRSQEDQWLYTHGVSRCTAVIIQYPGKFTYFAHLSPYDQVYNENRTDIIGNMLKRIEYLEITACDKHKLRFFVVSPNKTAFLNIVHKLMDQGYFLSQIVFMHNPAADHANIKSSGQEEAVLVNWKMNDGLFRLERGSQRESLQDQMENLSLH